MKVANVLRKLGADMRWFLEQQGIDPESARVLICVDALIDAQAVESAFHAQFDPEVMAVDEGYTDIMLSLEMTPRAVKSHGVKFSVVRTTKLKT